MTWCVTDLNPEQERVVLHHTGPMRVGAVAGAGKTTALIERVAYLVNKRKVPPNRILMISFSRAAKDEMKRRVDKRLPGMQAGSCVRTFHSIGLAVFQREGDPDKEFTVDTSGIMYLRATERAYKALGMKPEKKAIIRFAGLVKNNLLGTDEALRRLGKVDPRMLKLAEDCADEDAAVSAADLLSTFYKAEHYRSKEGIEHRGAPGVRFVGFDDMICESAMLLKRKNIRERWATRWDYVLQDEAQDENEAQAVIAWALASKTRNYMVVGDPAQSIYGWRGSNPERMLRFEQDWPGAQTIVMFRNYRSGIEIVDLANRIMGAMPATTVITDDVGDSMMMRSERQTHSHVSCHVFDDSQVEAEMVAMNIAQHHKEGVKYKDQAVLLRMNRMTRDIEVALATRAIPYKLVSGQSFFLMAEAKVLFGYLRVLLNRADQDAFKACVMNPSRKLGNAFIDKVAEAHDMVKRDWMASVAQAIPKLGAFQQRQAHEWMGLMKTLGSTVDAAKPAEFLTKLRDTLRLDDHFKRNTEDQEDSRSTENLDSLIEFAKNFESCKEMLDVVENVERHRAASTRKAEAVFISTIHKAKGMEWQAVYLIQVAGGLFPTTQADLNEERRCFYVACTRAMDELWISRPEVALKPDGRSHKTEISRFVFEAELPEIDQKHYQMGKKIDPMRVGTQIGLGL